jgi:hypothetical protein
MSGFILRVKDAKGVRMVSMDRNRWGSNTLGTEFIRRLGGLFQIKGSRSELSECESFRQNGIEGGTT